MDNKVKRKQLIEEARKRYPIKTKFKCAHDNSRTDVVNSHDFCSENDTDISTISNIGEWYVYFDGVWAEIISEPSIGWKW